MKKILKSVLLGIAWGCTVNCIVCLAIAFCRGEISFTANEFLIQVVASAIVGMGFSVPALVYQNDRLPQGIKCLIHMGIGFIVYFIAAFIAGWFPTDMGAGIFLTYVLIIIALSFVIYFFFWLYYRNEAKAINSKISQKSK